MREKKREILTLKKKTQKEIDRLDLRPIAKKVFVLHADKFLAGRVVILECFSSSTNIFFWIAIPPRLPFSGESMAGNEA